ncbi:MAG TPA: site-2 protease family protein [Candidatus Limnocylindrales bacterium]|nr:site-2 protease family protein [Candidatus Limnocylindrales bacterium]
MSGGIAVARLFGIEIRVSFAWAFLVALVTLVGSQQAAISAPELGAIVHWIIGLVVALTFLATVIAHELAHALVGRRRGVPATVIQLGFIGGLAPLSIEASHPRDELIIALAGPLVSLVVAGLALPAAMVAGAGGGVLTAVAGGVLVVGGLNLVLAVLSMLPGMPLDGGRVVRALAWAGTRDRDRASSVAARVGRLLGFTLVGVGVALALANMISGGLLVLCLGWLLATGSSTLTKRLALERLLRGATVADATLRDVPRIGPNLTIDTFADRFEGENRISCLPVMEDDAVLGVIGIKRLQGLGRRKFAATRAADVMATPPAARFLGSGEDLWTAVEMMNRLGYDGLAVVDDGAFAGMVVRESIGELIMARTGQGETARAGGDRA